MWPDRGRHHDEATQRFDVEREIVAFSKISRLLAVAIAVPQMNTARWRTRLKGRRPKLSNYTVDNCLIVNVNDDET